ncbi:unnamed protein product [Peniophora sp. CBMAI 1063]|nr:unnamed protein product [Peniophora sp. CBMAI 1063]
MPRKAKADSVKRREAQLEYDGLVMRAAEEYAWEVEKAEGNPPLRGVRKVSNDVSQAYYEETGRRISVKYRTVLNRYKGTPSLLEKREEQSLLHDSEKRLVISLCEEGADCGFPLTHMPLKDLVDSIVRSRDPHFVGVGQNWTKRFIERTPELSTLWTRGLETKRGQAVNPAAHEAWEKMLAEKVDGTPEECLLAADEVSMTTNHGEKHKAIGRAGKKYVYEQRSGSRENTTVIATIVADGTYLAPAVIFKGTAYQTSWKQNNPLNMSIGYSRKGWTNAIIGTEWIKQVEEMTREKAAGRRRVLIVDGHNSHYAYKAIRYAREHNMDMLSYAAHTTHVYQGLDVVAFATLKKFWAQEKLLWEKKHAPITKQNFLEPFARAWTRAMTPETIRSAFRATGVNVHGSEETGVRSDLSVIPETALAPSRATTTSAVMPFTFASPYRALGRIMRHAITSIDEDEVDPVIQGSRDLQRDLLKTSAHFLASNKPLKSTDELPELVPPAISQHHVPQELLELVPETAIEAQMQEQMRLLAEENRQLHWARENERAYLVTSQMYVEKARMEIHGKEEKAEQKKKKGRIDMGMPSLLTGVDFMKVVERRENLNQAIDDVKELRREAQERYNEECAQWRERNERRLQENQKRRDRYHAMLRKWEEVRDEARREGRRGKLPVKPKQGKLLPPEPKPVQERFPDPEIESDDAEDDAEDQEVEVDGEEEDEVEC